MQLVNFLFKDLTRKTRRKIALYTLACSRHNLAFLSPKALSFSCEYCNCKPAKCIQEITPFIGKGVLQQSTDGVFLLNPCVDIEKALLNFS